MGVAIELNLAVTYSESLPVDCMRLVCTSVWMSMYVWADVCTSFPPHSPEHLNSAPSLTAFHGLKEFVLF